MKIEKAIFGQVGQGHGLRSCSSNPEYYRKISQWLDLPDVVPAGVGFSPYISGFPFESKYILARSFIDISASRSGMMVVYAVAIDLHDISKIDNLNNLIELLPILPGNDDVFIESCDLREYREIEVEQQNGLNNNVIELLVDRKDGPLIHVGLDGFENLVCQIWFKLWPYMRENFSFRLSMSPKDCVETTVPHLVCIPTSLLSRWNNHKVIKEFSGQSSPSSAIKAFNAGYSEFENFCEIFGIEMKEPAMVGLLSEAKSKYQSVPFTFNDCISLIRYLEVLSPSNIKGWEAKNILVTQCAELVTDSDIADVLKLRNLKGIGFGDLNVVWDVISSKLSHCKYLEVDDTHFIKIIQIALFDNNAVSDWVNSVNAGLLGAISSLNSLVFVAIWRWSKIDVSVLSRLVGKLEINDSIECLIAENIPKDLSNSIAEHLVNVFSDKKLLILHGTILALYFPAKEAFEKQLEIDTNAGYVKGLNAIAANVDQSQLLPCCLHLNDVRVIDIVVNRAAINPSILESVSITSNISLLIWTRALKLNPELWNAPLEVQEIFFSLLDKALVAGCHDYDVLLNLLSTSPVSDLCDYQNVNEIWSVFDNTTKFNYLNATAKGWYRRALNLNFVKLDDVLEHTIYHLDGLIDEMVRDSMSFCEGVIGIFCRVNLFTEAEFKKWLEAWFIHQPSQQNYNSKAIGEIIKNKNWEMVAKFVLEKSKSFSSNASLILEYCKSILPLWERLRLCGCTPEEKWEFLTSILIDLYPSGPDESDIWSRSGGHLWDIWSFGSGYERWRRAIEKVKKGAKPNVDDLLKEVIADFPNNERVEVIREIFKAKK
ncbi:effector-associated domain EAD1-containing protein [Enterobacter hormaechei]|uniref:GAP1-N1 domain-containing protein n=1 Tax=Enterobacter hormaechei TaxID=158836 RepID=UPI001639EA5B|nr:effector-associated domain EAD1-containing protein [Enterobacter hormaechei]